MNRILNPRELWLKIKSEAQSVLKTEPGLTAFLQKIILSRSDLAESLTFLLAYKLNDAVVTVAAIKKIIARVLEQEPKIVAAAARDLQAVYQRDPACRKWSQPWLYFKGFQALQVYRIAHWFWQQRQTATALYLQSRSSELFGVDIHPAARLGAGILIDHATGVVIGETAVVEDNVSLLHEVTLGGTGKEVGDRHPKVRRGVLIGAGAKILGNIEIGEGAKVAAGSVVLKAVPPHCTVAGVPAKIVGVPKEEQPALKMDQEL